jgi:RNA polymerase sigma factor (TIGR02999 family)
LPLLYEELHSLAAERIRRENAERTLGATGLVHEAYLRLVGDPDREWNGRAHFFGAAAEAMRRILVEEARRRVSLKRGGDRAHVELEESALVAPDRAEDLIAVDEALERLEGQDPQTAELIKLRFHAGLSGREAAVILGVSPRKADQMWAYARAWLRREIEL